jgi:uncharacterized coiled-coil protein SlyX
MNVRDEWDLLLNRMKYQEEVLAERSARMTARLFELRRWRRELARLYAKAELTATSGPPSGDDK